MDIIKISLLGVCGVMLGFLMKGTKPEYACFITVGIGLVIMGLAVGKIRYLFESLGKIQEALPVDTEYPQAFCCESSHSLDYHIPQGRHHRYQKFAESKMSSTQPFARCTPAMSLQSYQHNPQYVPPA